MSHSLAVSGVFPARPRAHRLVGHIRSAFVQNCLKSKYASDGRMIPVKVDSYAGIRRCLISDRDPLDEDGDAKDRHER
jgi:hypothetical protein